MIMILLIYSIEIIPNNYKIFLSAFYDGPNTKILQWVRQSSITLSNQ